MVTVEGWPLAATGTIRIAPGASAGQLVEIRAPISAAPWNQPTNGGISQTASCVRVSTMAAMSYSSNAAQ